ncbi:MAG: hypothetical protein EBR09_05435 [Proteobacteria bacterium]|nr:hypothetical protein [Pseudomonadota bacterium]
MRRLTDIFLIFSAVLTVPSALAGSVSGSSSATGSSGKKPETNCDNRQRFIDCNLNVKNHILDKCFVVIHNFPQMDCTWQSCGYLSVIGEKPTFTPKTKGSETGVLTEYGLDTPVTLGKGWDVDSSGKVLPKRPFARHYMTVREALKLRSSPDGTEVAERLAKVKDSVLNANPYLSCALHEPSELVRVFTGKKKQGAYFRDKDGKVGVLTHVDGQSVMVHPDYVMPACRKLIDVSDDVQIGNLKCLINSDSKGDGGDELPVFLERRRNQPTAQPQAQPAQSK